MDQPHYESVGQWVKERREREGWTQPQLGEKIGATREQVGYIERNQKRGYLPDPEHVRALADLFSVSINFIYRLAGYPVDAPDEEELTDAMRLARMRADAEVVARGHPHLRALFEDLIKLAMNDKARNQQR